MVYVSPLKALSADIHKNLAEPRREIRRLAEEMGCGRPASPRRSAPATRRPRERAAMLETPPHILVTTPESLYLLLTSERSREMLRTVRTVIVDEIHAVIETRRGAHLALSLERLQHVARRAAAAHRALGHAEADRGGGRAGSVGDAATGRARSSMKGTARALDLALEMPALAARRR